MRKINHYVIRGTIELLSGMRIGGSDDILEIGGTDLTCIKHPVTGEPYIPGSSLKGKMRHCMERHHERYYRARSGRPSEKEAEGREPCNCAEPGCPICVVFGPHKRPDHKLGPSRIIVRDAHVVGSWEWEHKSSTAIDRLNNTGRRGTLRSEQCVAAGARFALEIGVQEFDIDKDFTYEDPDGNHVKGGDALLEVVNHALTEMERIGIGAGTGKGYGQIKIHWDGSVQECKRGGRRLRIAPSTCDQSEGSA